MTIGELIVSLRKLGVQAIMDDGKLKLRGPAGFLTPALKQAITQNRPELLRLLQAPTPLHAEQTSTNTWLELSPSQKQLWYEQQVNPDTSHYNVPIALKLVNDAMGNAAQQTLYRLLERHSGLRARFPVRDDRPVMEVEPKALAVAPTIIDLPHTADGPLLQSVILEFVRRPFQLSEGSPFRACLVRRINQDSVLVICLHHIVADGWSMGILLHEFEKFYLAFSEGEPPDTSIESPVRKQYSFSPASPSIQLLTEARMMLQGIPDLSLSCDFRRPETPSYRGGLCTAQLVRSDVNELSCLARRCHTTLFSVFSACFMMFLSYESSQRRFTVGTDIAGREELELEEVVGHFVNQIVMIADLTGSPSLEEIINRAASAFLQAHSMRTIPYDLLVKTMREVSATDIPLFRTKIVMQPVMPNSFAKLPDIKLLKIHDGSCKFDLLLNTWFIDDGVGLAIEYSRDLFNETTGERFMQHLLLLLKIMREENLPLRLYDINKQLSAAEHPTSRKPRSFSEIQRKDQCDSTTTTGGSRYALS